MPRTDVSHYDGLTWWGPVDDAQMGAALAVVDLPSGGRALDVGCGRGELLAQLAERGVLHLIGVDHSSAAVSQARALLEARAPDAEVSLLEMRAADYEADAGSLDLIANLGGPFSGATYATTLQTYARWLAPGGWLLSGQGFWMRPPPAPYLEATGISVDALLDEDGNQRSAREAGFDAVYRSASDREAWDHFEGTILRNREAQGTADPRHRRWHDAQQRWGRDTMGFALYVYRLRG